MRLVDLAARHREVAASVEARVLDVLRSGVYVGGPVVAEAEAALAVRLGVRHAVGVGSGTDALALGLEALELPPGARVALPALSFFATVESVRMAGYTPVFVDVLADRPLLDPAQVPEDVDAVVLVHLFGMRCPAPCTRAVVLSDAAQCLGWAHGRPEGLLGALSLYPTKTLGAAGDAGLVCTDDPALAERVRRLGSHGMSAPHLHVLAGRNSRLDAVQAAVVLGHLPALEARAQARRRVADRYDAALAGHPGVRPLPRDPRDGVHQYVVRCTDRQAVRAALEAQGVDSAVYYPRPMDTQPVWTGRPDAPSACPQAARFCAEALALPCHEGLRERDLERVLAGLGVG